MSGSRAHAMGLRDFLSDEEEGEGKTALATLKTSSHSLARSDTFSFDDEGEVGAAAGVPVVGGDSVAPRKETNIAGEGGDTMEEAKGEQQPCATRSRARRPSFATRSCPRGACSSAGSTAVSCSRAGRGGDCRGLAAAFWLDLILC